MKYFCALYITETVSSLVHEEVGVGRGQEGPNLPPSLPSFPVSPPFLGSPPFWRFLIMKY